MIGPVKRETLALLGHIATFRSAGCCGACSLGYALWATEKEHDRKWTPGTCRNPDCKIKARLAWDRASAQQKETE